MPTLIQRLEGGALFAASTFLYFHNSFSWRVFIIVWFALDLSMIGYIANKKLGVVLCNIGHSLAIPILLIIPYVFTANPVVLGFICIWFAYIGIDRALGYGLKLPSGFQHTHLGDIGKKK